MTMLKASITFLRGYARRFILCIFCGETEYNCICAYGRSNIKPSNDNKKERGYVRSKKQVEERSLDLPVYGTLIPHHAVKYPAIYYETEVSPKMRSWLPNWLINMLTEI